MADALLSVGINLMVGAALWGLGLLFKKRQHTVVNEVQDKEIQISTYGAVKRILYGQCKVALQLVAAQDNLVPYPIESKSGGKGLGGGSTTTQMNYLATFAGILGVAPDPSVFGEFKLLKLWADTKLAYNVLDADIVTQGPWVQQKLNFYPGTDDQPVDPWISTGSWGVTAYRGRVFIVVRNLNVTNFSNRIPTIRALIGPAVSRDVTGCPISAVPAWWGDGENQDRFYSLQIILSKDFSYYVCIFPDWLTGPNGDITCCMKIDSYSGQLISRYDFNIADLCMELCEDEGQCEPAMGWQYGDPFGWHHPAAMDELGRVYAAACDGYGRIYRLNSDTWEIEASSPQWPNEESVFESDTGLDRDVTHWTFQQTRVVRNPSYPYLYVSSASIEQNSLGPQGIAMINRETMADPFDENHWAHIFWGPKGRTGEDWVQGYWFRSGAFCVNDKDGSCFVLWTSTQDPYPVPPIIRSVWLSRFYPNGSRLDVETNLDRYNYNVMWHRMTYDPDTDQLIIMVQDSPTWEEYESPNDSVVFYNGNLEYITKISLPPYSVMSGENGGEDTFQHGVINGLIYFCGGWSDPEDKIRIFKLDVRTRTYEIICEFDSIEDLNGGCIFGTLFNPFTGQLVCELYDGDYSDTFLRTIQVTALTAQYVDLADIVYDLCRRSGMSHEMIDVEDLRNTEVKGFIVNSDKTTREAIEELMKVFIFDAVDEDGKLKFKKRGKSPDVTIPEEDLGYFMVGSERTEPLGVEMPEETSCSRKIEVVYPDVGRKHELYSQSAERFLTDIQTINKINSSVLLNHGEAVQLADISLKYEWNTKKCVLSLGPKYADLSPTDVITVERLEAAYRIILAEGQKQGLLTHWKGIVEDVSYTGALKLPPPLKYIPSEGRLPLYTSDLEGNPPQDINEQVSYQGPSYYHLIDLPPIKNSHNIPGVYVASGGVFSLYEGCEIFVSKNSGLSWNHLVTVPERAITGITLTKLEDFNGNGIDNLNSLTIRWNLSSDSLDNKTTTQFLNGDGICLVVGEEVICAKNVETLSEGVQLISPPLLRGYFSTDYAKTGHVAGERVVVINTNTLFLATLDSSYLNMSYLYNAVTFEDEWNNGSKKVFKSELRTLKPLSGVQAIGSRDGSNNLTITWSRRDRFGQLNPFKVGVEVPMSEYSESYEIDILDNGSVLRTITGLSNESASYTAAQQIVDGITPGDPITCNIYQISNSVGRGWPLNTVI